MAFDGAITSVDQQSGSCQRLRRIAGAPSRQFWDVKRRVVARVVGVVDRHGSSSVGVTGEGVIPMEVGCHAVKSSV